MSLRRRVLDRVIAFVLGAGLFVAPLLGDIQRIPFAGISASSITTNSITVGTLTTAGNAICSIDSTMGGASATDNFLNCTGTFPGTLSATGRGAVFSFTTDNDAQTQEGLYVNLTSVGVGSVIRALSAEITPSATNNSEGTAVYGLVNAGSASNNFTFGGKFVNNTAFTGSRFAFGARGFVQNNINGTYGVGLFGSSTSDNNGGAASRNVGVFGIGDNASGTPAQGAGVIGLVQTGHTAYNGGWFGLSSTINLSTNPSAPTITGTAALVADNGAVAANIFEARDNGTATFTIADAGVITATGTTFTMSGSGGIFAADQHQIGSSTAFATIQQNTAQTPDTAQIALGTTSNTLVLTLFANRNTDGNNGPGAGVAVVDPTLIVQTAAGGTTQYQALSGTGLTGGWIKALTGGSATAVLRIPVASGAGTGGTLFYTVFASDATDHQTRHASVRIAVENKAGTEVCGLSATSEVLDLSAVAVSTGTLTYTIACSTSPTNAVDITFQAVSSLTETTLNFYGTYIQDGPGLPARQ